MTVTLIVLAALGGEGDRVAEATAAGAAGGGAAAGGGDGGAT